MASKASRDELGHRLALVYMHSEAVDPWMFRIILYNTAEWLSLQEAVSQEDFPGWAGRFQVLAPGCPVLTAQLVDIDANDLNSALAYRKTQEETH